MPNDKLKKLWENVGQEYDLPDYAVFEKDMQDESKRKKLWDAVGKDYDLPEFEQFSDDMGFKKKVPTKPSQQPTQQQPSQTSVSASLPPLGQKPAKSESVTPSTSKTDTGGYAITTPDSVATGDNLVTSESAAEKARKQALADKAERERIQAKYAETVFNWEKQPKEKIKSPGGAPKNPLINTVYEGPAYMGTDNIDHPITFYDADFSEYLKRTKRFVDQVGSLTARKINAELDGWAKTELPEILNNDKEYLAEHQNLQASVAKLSQAVANGEIPRDAAEAKVKELNAAFGVKANNIAAQYIDARQKKADEEFKQLYGDELKRSAKKIKGEEYYKALTEVFKSQAFKGLSIDDKKQWIKEAWARESKDFQGTQKEYNDLYDEFMRNMVGAVSYDDKGQPTSFALKEMAAEKLAKITADYNNYLATHPNAYGALSEISPSQAKIGQVPKTDPIMEEYQRSMRMLQDVVDAPNDAQTLGFMNSIKSGNLGMLWDGMKSKAPLPFARPLDDLQASTMMSAISKKDPKTWNESERAFMDGLAIKEQFDKSVMTHPAYNMGAGLSGSLEYVGEFIATGGIYSGTAGAAERAALKMLKIPSRTLEKGIVTAAENLTTKQAVRYWSIGQPLKWLLASSAQTAANPQRYMNGVVQRMSPGVELALSEDGDELIAELDKNYITPEGYRTGHNQGALESIGRSYGEELAEFGTERMGGGVTWLGNQMARGVLKGVKSVDLLKRLYIGYYMSKYGLNKSQMMAKIISEKMGWHGFLPELSEELMNMPLTNIATGEAPISKGLLIDTEDGEGVLGSSVGIDWDNLFETAGVVALQSPLMNSPHMIAGIGNYIGNQFAKDPMRMTAVFDENGLGRSVEVPAPVVELMAKARASKDFKALIKLKEEELPKMKLKPEERALANRLIDSVIYEATDPKAFDNEIAAVEKELSKPETDGPKKAFYEKTLATLQQKKKEAERAGEKRKEYAANANGHTKLLKEFDAQLKIRLQKVANEARQPDIEDEENAGDFEKAEKVSMKLVNGESLDTNDFALSKIYPKLIQQLYDIEVERKAMSGLAKKKTDYNEAEFNKSFDQRKEQLLGVVEKDPKSLKENRWADKMLRFNPQILDVLLSITPKEYQPEAIKQLAGEFGIEGPVDSIAEFLARLNETTILGMQEEEQQEEQQPEPKEPVIPLSTLNNKPVVFKKRRGILSIDEGGKVTVETPSKIYELEAGPESDANELDIQEVKVVDDVIENVSEETATVNGQEYKIKTDKKGNIIRLIGGKKDIKDEDILVAVEIERNKLPLPKIIKEKIDSTPKEVTAAVGEAVGMSPLELKAIERILELNMNDDVAAALDKMLEGEEIEDFMYYKVSLWAEDVINRLEKVKADVPNGLDYIESLINGVYEILNQIPDGKITEKPTEKQSSGENNDKGAEPEPEEDGGEEDSGKDITIDLIRGVGAQFGEMQKRQAMKDNYQRQMERYEKNPTEEIKNKILELEKALGYTESYFDAEKPKAVGEYRPEAINDIVSEGNKTIINFADGDKHKAVYVIAPIKSVLPSHHPVSFHKTKGYPVDEKGNTTNDRNYSDPVAQGMVAKYSNKPDPQALLDTSTYTMTGPPIITNDLFVVGGNNRQMVLMNMSEEAYFEYYEALREITEIVGVELPEYDNENRVALYRKDNEAAPYSKANSAKYNKPVGKEKDAADEMISFSTQLQAHPTAVEQISNIIGEYNSFSEFFNSRKAVRDVRGILLQSKVVSEKDLNMFFDSEGMFTKQGILRFRSGLFATMFDEDIVRLMDEDGVTKFVNKIESAVPVIASNFRIDKYSLKEEIQAAIRLQAHFASWKRERMKEAKEGAKDTLTMLDFIKALDLFSMPNIHAVRMWFLIDKSSVNNNYFKSLLMSYNNSASDKGAGDMFAADAPKSKEEFLTLLKKYLPNEDNKIIEDALSNQESSQADAGGTGSTGSGSTEETDTKKFTESSELNKMLAELKDKHGDKQGGAIYDAAVRLVNPNENHIVEIRYAGVVVKENGKLIFKAFSDTDLNNKKWGLYPDREITEPKEPKPSKAAKRKLRDEADQKAADDAWNDLLNLGIADSPEQQLKRFEAANKILAIYFKRGIYKLTDILEDGAVNLGEKLRDLFEMIKDRYLAYQSRATEEELDKMQSIKEVRAINIDEILKQQQEDDTDEPLDTDAGQGNSGAEPGNGEDAELPPGDNEKGGVDGEGNGESDGGGGKGGQGGGGSVGGFRGRSSVKNYNLAEKAESPTTFNIPQRYEDNIAAIELLTELIESGKQATTKQQEVLAKYVGFGGLKEILLNPDNDGDWADSTRKYKPYVKRTIMAVAELENALKAKGKAPEFGMWQFLRESVDTSFYTPFELVHGIYYALNKLGFKSGKLLEPSAGIGNFFVGMPKSMFNKSMLQAVELDYITGNILKQLFPEVATHLGSYEEFADQKDSYDVVVSNIPFSNRIRIKGLAIHNYFFKQALENVRPGGIIAFVTSTGVMDAVDDTTRKYIEENGYFLGAMRLGDKAFKASNTSVTSDIIFIQKKGSEIKAPKKTYQFQVGDGFLNEYFKTYPESVFGEVKTSTYVRQSGSYVESPEGINHEEAIKKWVDANLVKVYDESKSIKEQNDTELVRAEKAEWQKVNNLYYKNGQLSYIQSFDEQGNPLIMSNKFITLSKDHHRKIQPFIKIRNAFNKLVYLEYHDYPDAEVDQARRDLNRAYDEFVSQFGKLQDKSNAWMEMDVDGYNVRSLERVDKDTGEISKADMFFQRTIKPLKSVTKTDNLQEAVLISLSNKAKIDVEFIEEVMGLEPGGFYHLDKTGVLFYEPDKEEWTVRDHYLSGNVKRKLREAKKAYKLHNDFVQKGGKYDGAEWLKVANDNLAENIKELEAVQPPDVPAINIYTPLGTRWIPKEVFEAFANHIFDTRVSINLNKASDKWDVDIRAVGDTVKMRQYELMALHSEDSEGDTLTRYHSPRYWLQAALNNEEPRIVDTVGTGQDRRQVFNESATNKAINLFNRIRKEFTQWVYNDIDRRQMLETLYNEKYNDIVLRTNDGSHLSMPGIHHYTLDPHQKDAIWMLLMNRGGIIDHMVGAGKSLVAVGAIMEMRRLGIAKKPMIAALKAQLPQMVKEFKKAYPGAKILTLNKETDFSAKNRKRILSQIANNDWDAVIITHDNFNAIPHEKQIQIDLINEELQELEELIRKDAKEGKQFERDLNKRLSDKREQLKKLLDKKEDKEMLTFQKLGVDMLFVDESQKFKNLQFSSKLPNIKGLGNQKGSSRAFNMHVATTSLHKLRGADEGVVFMSGTPISNSLSEMYLLMKYLRPQMLKEKGITTFDVWADLFAINKRDYEFYMGGYREINRFRAFGNVPELFKMYREIADIRNETNLPIDRPKAKHELVKVPMTTLQLRYQKEIEHYIALRGRGAPWVSDSNPKAYGMLAVDASKKMSLDLRLVMSEREWEQYAKEKDLDLSKIYGFGSKIEAVSENVAKIYHESTADRGTQLIFCDLGVPKSKNQVENLFTYLKDTETDENMELIFGKTGDEFYDMENKPSMAAVVQGMKDVLGFTQEQVNFAVEESKKERFNAYQEIKNTLIQKGVAADQIAFIHDWNGPKRSELYDKMKNGDIRVLIGSTDKMGIGVSVQDRALAAHHVDIKWTPAELEQRNGRVERRGNWLAKEKYGNEVRIYYYALEGSLDSYMYGVVGAKANFIRQQRTSNLTERYIEDIDEALDFAEMASIIAGNQNFKDKLKAEKQLGALEEEKMYMDQQVLDARSGISRREGWIQDRFDDKAREVDNLTIYEQNYPKVDRTTVGEKGMQDLLMAFETHGLDATVLWDLIFKDRGDKWRTGIEFKDKLKAENVNLYDVYKTAQKRINDRVVKEGDYDIEIVDAIELAYQEYRQLEKLKDEADYQVTLFTPSGNKVFNTAKEAGKAFFDKLQNSRGVVGSAYGFDIAVKAEMSISGKPVTAIVIQKNGIPISKEMYAVPETVQINIGDDVAAIENSRFITMGKALRADVLNIKSRIEKHQKDIDLFKKQIEDYKEIINNTKFEKDDEIQELLKEIERINELIAEDEKRKDAEVQAEIEAEKERLKRKKDEEEGEGEDASPATPRQQSTQSIADKLERLKIDTSGRKTYALPFPPQLWNGFISAIQVGVRAGEKLAFAINRGIQFLKENNVKNIDEYVKHFSEEEGIPYVPGNPFQPNYDRPLFDREIDAKEYIAENNMDGMEPRFINGQFTIAPKGEKGLRERIEELGPEASIHTLYDELKPLGYTETEITVMRDPDFYGLEDDASPAGKKYHNQALGVQYVPIDRNAPMDDNYFKSKFVRPILFQGSKAGVEPFSISKRVRDLFKKELGFDIQERMIRKKYEGLYKPQSARVRVQSLLNVIVAAHEGMHAIDYSETPKISERVQSLGVNHPLVEMLKEIYMEFYPTAKTNAPLATQIKEGMSSLVERFCQDPVYMMQKYRLAVNEFIDPRGMFYNPKTTILINGIHSIIRDYQNLEKDSDRVFARVSEVANSGNPEWLKNANSSKFKKAISKLKFILFNTLEPARFIDQLAGVAGTDESVESYAAARRRLYGIIDPWIHGRAPAVIYDGNGNYRTIGNLSIAKALEGLSQKEIILLNAYLIARRGVDDLNRMNVAANEATLAWRDFKDAENDLMALIAALPADPATWSKAQVAAVEKAQAKADAYETEARIKKMKFLELEDMVIKDKFDQSSFRGTLTEVEFSPDDDAKTRKRKAKIQKGVEVYDSINQHLLDYAYNGGLISREKYIEWKNNKAYASFARHITDDMDADAVMSGGVKFFVSKSISAFKKRHGSDLEIILPMYSQLSHITQVITQVHENIMWKQLEKLAVKDTNIGRLFERHQPTYRKEGRRFVAAESRDNSFVKIMDNGTERWYKLAPELVAMRETFKENGFDWGGGLGVVPKMLGDIGRLTSRMITTAFIYFPIINMPMDTFSKFMNAPSGGKGWYRVNKYLPTSITGASAVTTNAITEQVLNSALNIVAGKQLDWSDVSDWIGARIPVGMQTALSPVFNKFEKTYDLYSKYSALGARAATMSSTHMTPQQKLLHIKTINASIWKKLISFGPGYTALLKEAGESIISFAEIPSNTSEYLIRFETFKQAKANGDSDMLAMYKAEQATVAFVQHGANPVVAGIMRSIIFANAGMQVFYRYGSSWMHNPARMAAIHTLFMAASVLIIDSLLKMPDDKKEILDSMSLEEWGRYLTYWKDGNSKPTRIRIPDQLGLLNMFNWYMMRGNKDKDIDGAFKQAAKAMSDPEFFNATVNLVVPSMLNVVPVAKKGGGVDVKNTAAKMLNTIPTFMKTGIEAGLGVRTYPRVAPLDMWMSGEEIDKYDKYTSELAKDMSELIGGSPMQHDHFIRGTLGRSFQLLPYVGQKREVKNPLVYDPPMFKGAYYNAFYETLHANEDSKESLIMDVEKNGLTIMHEVLIDNYVARAEDDKVKEITFEEFKEKFPNVDEGALEKIYRRTNAYFDWSVQNDVAQLIKECRAFYKDNNEIPKNTRVGLWKLIEVATYEPDNLKKIQEIIEKEIATDEFAAEIERITDERLKKELTNKNAK